MSSLVARSLPTQNRHQVQKPLAEQSAIHSEMNRAIVGDDDVRAFNYFLTGKATLAREVEPNLLESIHESGDASDLSYGRSSSLRGEVANSPLQHTHTTELQRPLQQQQSSMPRQPRKLTQFYYKLKNLNDKIQVFTHLFYNKTPKFEHTMREKLLRARLLAQANQLEQSLERRDSGGLRKQDFASKVQQRQTRNLQPLGPQLTAPIADQQRLLLPQREKPKLICVITNFIFCINQNNQQSLMTLSKNKRVSFNDDDKSLIDIKSSSNNEHSQLSPGVLISEDIHINLFGNETENRRFSKLNTNINTQRIQRSLETIGTKFRRSNNQLLQRVNDCKQVFESPRQSSLSPTNSAKRIPFVGGKFRHNYLLSNNPALWKQLFEDSSKIVRTSRNQGIKHFFTEAHQDEPQIIRLGEYLKKKPSQLNVIQERQTLQRSNSGFKKFLGDRFHIDSHYSPGKKTDTVILPSITIKQPIGTINYELKRQHGQDLSQFVIDGSSLAELDAELMDQKYIECDSPIQKKKSKVRQDILVANLTLSKDGVCISGTSKGVRVSMQSLNKSTSRRRYQEVDLKRNQTKEYSPEKQTKKASKKQRQESLDVTILGTSNLRESTVQLVNQSTQGEQKQLMSPLNSKMPKKKRKKSKKKAWDFFAHIKETTDVYTTK